MQSQSLPTEISLTLPEWLHGSSADLCKSYPGDHDKMGLAIDLAARNVAENTGGPFGAAIFDSTTGMVVSVGVNRVIPLCNSTAHAEMMAFMLAQNALQSHRLNANQHNFVMATSAQMCAMCYGASVWAGVNRILIGARREDVESLTDFDEGPMPRNWIKALLERDITVARDIRRVEACEVLKSYQDATGPAY